MSAVVTKKPEEPPKYKMTYAQYSNVALFSGLGVQEILNMADCVKDIMTSTAAYKHEGPAPGTRDRSETVVNHTDKFLVWLSQGEDLPDW